MYAWFQVLFPSVNGTRQSFGNKTKILIFLILNIRIALKDA